MKMKKIATFVVALSVSCGLIVHAENKPAATPTPKATAAPVATPTPAAKKPTPKSETRYMVTAGADEWIPTEAVGFTQPVYAGPETLNGLGKKTASELGISGRLVRNDYGKRARLVKLSPSAVVYYDTASGEPRYLDGCVSDGKPFANRVQLVQIEKPVAVSTPAPTPPPTLVVVPDPTPAPQSAVHISVPSPSAPAVAVAANQSKVIPLTDLWPDTIVYEAPPQKITINGRRMNNAVVTTPAGVIDRNDRGGGVKHAPPPGSDRRPPGGPGGEPPPPRGE